MSGLNRIIDRIIADANASAELRIARAKDEAAASIARKDSEIAAEMRERIQKEKEAIAVLENKSRSSTESDAKKRLLSERVALIEEVLDRARAGVSALSPEERIAMIERFVCAHADELTGDCELIVGPQDFENASESFVQKLNDSIRGTLRIAKVPGDFSAGCVLRCGRIEYNGTIDAIMNDHMDEIRDQINRRLFFSDEDTVD